MDKFRGLQATDPRDKIYALLGLIQITRLYLDVNYDRSVPLVLFDVVKQSMHLEANLNFLSFVDLSPTPAERNKLHNWMPRWDQTCSLGSFPVWCGYSAVSTCDMRTLIKSPNSYSPRLYLKGVYYADIASTTNVLAPDNTRVHWVLIIAFMASFLGKARNGSDHDGLAKFATTLTAGYLLGASQNGWCYLDHLHGETGQQFMADFRAFLALYCPQQSIDMPVSEYVGDASMYQDLVEPICYGRTVFMTLWGRIGLGPRTAKPGDVVVVLDGDKVPYLLRKVEERTEYVFIGECYILDIMNGEVYDKLDKPGVFEQEFVLR